MPARKTHEQFMKEITALNRTHHDHSKINYKGNLINITIICKYHGEYQIKPRDYLKSNYGCKNCGFTEGKYHKLTDKEVNEYLFNLNLIKADIYKNNHESMNLTCLICNYNWKASYSSIKDKNVKCQSCFGNKWSNYKIDNYLKNNHINIIRIDNFIYHDYRMNWQCLKCNHIWPTKLYNIIKKDGQGTGCPNCSSGKNEGIIRNFLETNGILTAKIQVKLPINKTKYNCFPDFYISEFNLFIEYNGEQHYKPVKFGGISKEKADEHFEYQLIRDQQMRNYCKENNIQLWEIDGRRYTGNKLIRYLNSCFKIIDNKMTYIHDCN